MSKQPRLPIVDEMRSMLKTAPFVGMVIRTSDGESFRISHQDYVLISPRGDLIHCYDDEQHPHILNPRQIVSIAPAKMKSKRPEKETGE